MYIKNSAGFGVNQVVHKMVLKCMLCVQLTKVPVQQVFFKCNLKM